MTASELFVRLLHEGVDVWRPVLADLVTGNVYRICDQPYDRGTETWEFDPGALVVGEQVAGEAGHILTATSRADSGAGDR